MTASGDAVVNPLDRALEVRLAAARSAQERTRLALFATTVISFALLTASWNSYVSFYRPFAHDHRGLARGDDATSGLRRLQETVLSEWVRSHWISISLLGIQVGVDDAPTLGASALIVALMWFYLCMRREHYTIGYLLYDYRDADPATQWLIFHGVNLYTVFTTVGHSDIPMNSLQTEPSFKEWRGLRSAIFWLHSLPAVALSVVIFLDVTSLFMASPFREDPNEPLFQLLLRGGSTEELARVVFWDVVGLGLLVLVYRLCARVRGFARATQDILFAFKQKLPPGGGVSPAAGG
jgi:hypothetical protein